MKMINKGIWAFALTLAAFNFGQGIAVAQEPVAGKFTLPHDVHWQSAIVPAGDYAFSVQPRNLVVLRKISNRPTTFVLMGQDAEPAKPSAESNLLLVSRAGNTFVKSMQVPESGLLLNFTVPRDFRK